MPNGSELGMLGSGLGSLAQVLQFIINRREQAGDRAGRHYEWYQQQEQAKKQHEDLLAQQAEQNALARRQQEAQEKYQAGQLQQRDYDSFLQNFEKMGLGFQDPRKAFQVQNAAGLPQIQGGNPLFAGADMGTGNALNAIRQTQQAGAESAKAFSPNSINFAMQEAMPHLSSKFDPRTGTLTPGQPVYALPGTEGVGGMMVKSPQMNPASAFAAMSNANLGGARLQADQFKNAMDDIQNAYTQAYTAHLNANRQSVASITDPGSINSAARVAARNAARPKAISWARQLGMSPEMLLGQLQDPAPQMAAPSPRATQGPPTPPSAPTGGGVPLPPSAGVPPKSKVPLPPGF